MAKITILDPVQVAPGVQVLERRPSSGMGWSVTVLQLPGGGTLVYSPSWLDDDTFQRVEAFGPPRVLCAPNNGHHLSLEKYRERWPEAQAVASAQANLRLSITGHPGMREVESVAALLPRGAAWHHHAANKTGEVWLSVPHAKGTTLVVCDAFFNLAGPLTGPLGWLLRQLHVGPGLKVTTPYPWLALTDVAAARAWMLQTVKLVAPTELVVGHGPPLVASDLVGQLTAAIERRWPT